MNFTCFPLPLKEYRILLDVPLSFAFFDSGYHDGIRACDLVEVPRKSLRFSGSDCHPLVSALQKSDQTWTERRV